MNNTILKNLPLFIVLLLFSITSFAINPIANTIDKDMVAKMPLKDILANYYSNNLYIGIANHAKLLGKLSTEIADREFSYITPANDFKQSYIHPTFEHWRWKQSDTYLEYAKSKGQLLRLHSPISPQCSKWVKEDNRTADELTQMLNEYLMQLCIRYNNQSNVLWMDVVNETIAKDDLSDPVFGNQKRGEWFSARQGVDKWENPWTLIGYDESSDIRTPLYIDMAFEISNKYAPNIKQIINQHGSFEPEVWEKMKKLVYYLRSKGRRIDGIGWQAHIDCGWEKKPGNIERLNEFVNWCHKNDLEFHITEMNVWIKNKEKQNEQMQADTYGVVVNALINHLSTGVIGISFWNVRDEDTSNPQWQGCLWRNDGTERPAYNRIKEELINHIVKNTY